MRKFEQLSHLELQILYHLVYEEIITHPDICTDPHPITEQLYKELKQEVDLRG